MFLLCMFVFSLAAFGIGWIFGYQIGANETEHFYKKQLPPEAFRRMAEEEKDLE